MMKSLLTFLGALFLGTAKANAILTMVPVINPANLHTYYLLEPTNWVASEAQAVAMGGHLVTINDAAEQEWVMGVFGDKGSLWIGLSDTLVDGTFAWSSGEPVSYTHWHPGEPNGRLADEDYVLAWWSGYGAVFSGNWNDITNVSGYTTFGVVEINTHYVAAAPEPSKMVLALIGLSAALLRRSRSGAMGASVC